MAMFVNNSTKKNLKVNNTFISPLLRDFDVHFRACKQLYCLQGFLLVFIYNNATLCFICTLYMYAQYI